MQQSHWRLCLACGLTGCLASGLTTLFLQSPGLQVAAQEGLRRPIEPFAQRTRVEPEQFAEPSDMAELTPEEAVNIAVYEAANRSVVNITSRSRRNGTVPFLELQSEGAGSGSIIDTEGHIVTNFHVVQDADAIAVTLFNGKTYDATVVGSDPLNDLAVIQIEAEEEELFPVVVGNSRPLRVGMRVFALGNPFGLERTLTTGIISSLNRTLKIRDNWTIKSIIQIDAAINPGSSGGPLLDTRGRLIGINTAIATTSGQNSGVGFAIPSSLVQRVVPQLIKHGRAIRPDTGIQSVFQTEEGLLVGQIRAGSPAEKAGLRGPKITRTRRGPFVAEKIDRSAADLIVQIDDEQIAAPEDLLSYVDNQQPGQTIILKVIRDGKPVQVPLELTKSDAPDAR